MKLKRRWWLWGRQTLDLSWNVGSSEPLINQIVNTQKQLAQVTEGEPIVPPTWTLARYLVTPHPLGGCAMSDTADGGVVDHTGHVFGYDRLYVADGAIFPAPIGVNPSRTIAALAERCAEFIVRR
jgi:cholesterol oxidase